MRTLAQIDAELREVNAAIDALYWTYTRTKRGKPPCIVRPELYTQRTALMSERREIARAA